MSKRERNKRNSKELDYITMNGAEVTLIHPLATSSEHEPGSLEAIVQGRR